MSHKLGIIVPYRDRPDQLSTFTDAISNYITDIDYELIIVNQQDDNDFNRGKLLNIGFDKAEQLGCDYVVFHDIDMLPVDVDYSYSDTVVHLIDQLETPKGFDRDNFDEYFGGVTLFPSHIFKHINGYTNEYWGWGFEDDNLLLRCKSSKVTLNKKEVKQKQRDGIGLQFNGKNSFVACPNIFNSVRDHSIVVNFSIDSTIPTETNITDEYSIFSIPGRDTTLTYNSFKNFAFQFWKKDLSSMNINTDHYPDGTYSCVINIHNSKSLREVTFYLNGENVGSLAYDKLSDIKIPKYFYLGVGDPDRKDKNNYLHGSINNFAVYRECLSEIQILRFSNNFDYSLFSLGLPDPVLYYDGKFCKGNQLIDLSGNNHHGTTFNCTQTTTTKSTTKQVDIPIRRKGTFKALPHSENGYKLGYWTSWKSRENQIDYIKKFYSGNYDFDKDGLNTLHYSITSYENKDNYHLLNVVL